MGWTRAGGTSQRAHLQVIGLDELDETLSRLSGVLSRRVMRPGLGAAATAFKKIIRANINATPITADESKHATSLKRGVRKSVGSSIKKDVRHGYTMKLGYGVGMKGGKRLRRLSAGKTRGKGIAGANVHWFVLGTGEMKAFFQGALKRSIADGQATAINKLTAKVRQRLAIEAQKARKGG